MKTLIALLMASIATVALANETTTPSHSSVEQYRYGESLDIAKVISLSTVPNVCEVVPQQMTYEDPQGHRHTLEFQVMGDGCSTH